MVDPSAADAAPLDVGDGADAVLLLHGLTSSPYDLRLLAEALAERGLRARAPRIIGHGTRAEALAHTRWPDWLATARHAFDDLAQRHARVFVAGQSMGALCALVLGHERGARVAGIVSMATPLRLAFKQQTMLRAARRVPIADLYPFAYKREGPDVSDPAVAAAMPSYDRIPVAAAASMLDGQDEALDRADRIAAPTLVLHGRHDHVAPVENADRLLARLGTPYKRRIVYPRSWHILTLDVDHAAVVRDVVDFVSDPQGFTQRARTR